MSADEVYALTAFILHLNGLVEADAVLDAKTLVKVEMPNAHGFIREDPRPDTHNVACMEGCPPIEVGPLCPR